MEIMNAVSTEFLLLIGIAVSGGVFLWKIQRSLKSDISDLRKEVKDDISDLNKEVNSLGQRIARIEGILIHFPKETLVKDSS